MTPLLSFVIGCFLILVQPADAVRSVKPSCDCSKYRFNDEETSLLKGYSAETEQLLDKSKEFADNYQKDLIASSQREAELFAPILQADQELREVMVETDADGSKLEGKELFGSIMSYFSEHEQQVLEADTVQQSLERVSVEFPKLANWLETVPELLIKCIEARRSNLYPFWAAEARTRDFGRLLTTARNVDLFLKQSKVMKTDPRLVTKQTSLCQDAPQVMPDDLKMLLQNTCTLPVDQATQLYRKQSEFVYQAVSDDCEDQCGISLE